MAKQYFVGILIGVLIGLVTGECEETNEESTAASEYMKIFRNIPKFFENFINLLEQRVEVLETDDISMYQKNFNYEESENTAKRETDQYCAVNSNQDIENQATHDIIKRDTNNDYIISHNKNRNNINDMKEASTTDNTQLKIHEYGRAGGYKTDLANARDPGSIDNLFKRQEINNKRSTTGKVNGKDKKLKNRKRYVRELGENDFAGSWWAQLLNLAPEEVEEKAIKTEQMMEDHNKKSRRK